MKKVALIPVLATLCMLAACTVPPASLDIRPDPTAPSLQPLPSRPAESFETESPDPTEAVSSAASNATVEIPETLVYDQDGIRATIQPCSLPVVFDPETEYEIPIFIENTSDQEIRFCLADDAISIDNRMIHAWLFRSVDANSAELAYLCFGGDDAARINLQNPKTFSARFLAFAPRIFDARLAVLGTFCAAEPAFSDCDTILYEENGLVIYEDGLYRGPNGYGAKYYLAIENNSGQDLLFTVDGAELNGIPVSVESNACAVFDGCVSFYLLDFSQTALDEANLKFPSMEEISFTIRCLNLESVENNSVIENGAYELVSEIPIAATFAP